MHKRLYHETPFTLKGSSWFDKLTANGMRRPIGHPLSPDRHSMRHTYQRPSETGLPGSVHMT